jgi:hypothetical protein
MGKSDSLADPVKFRFLISTSCPPYEHRQGSPVFILVWLPLRVTPVTPGVHPSLLAVFVRIDPPVFPFVGEGRQLHCEFRGYIQVRSRCDPQVCSTPLKEPSSGNLALQVTLYTSLKLRGRTAELPRSDFNRQVIRFPRHAVQIFNSR